MMQALFLLGLGLFCVVCVWCAVHALQFLTVDRAIAARIGRLRLSVLCFGLGVGAAMADGVLLPMHLSDFGLVVLVVWATITAMMDRATTWVPDISAVMLLFGALIHDPALSALGWLPVWQAVCSGASPACVAGAAMVWAVILWLIALLAFKAQLALRCLVLTAADIVAVALPLIAFGTSLGSTIGYFLAALVVVLAGRFAPLHRWLAEARALREGLDDLGQTDIAPSRALPAFVIFAPITAAMAVALSVSGAI